MLNSPILILATTIGHLGEFMDRAIYILGVDDEPNLLDSLKRMLRSKKYRFFAATSAEAGLKILENQYMDVVISDQKMPGMSGNVFLKTVREKYPDIVRLMMSGQSSVKDLMSAINDGEIFRFLAKPFIAQDLENIINLAMEQKQLLGILTDQISNLSRDQISEVSSVETFADQGYIHVKITNSITQENISRILNLIRQSLSDHKDFDIKMTSRVPAKEKDALWITLSLGKNLSIKIEFANPLSFPAWVNQGTHANHNGSEKHALNKSSSKK